jgi:hypothetical protein
MMIQTRKAGILGVSLILIVFLTAAVGLPREAGNRDPSDVTWHMNSEWDDHQQSDTSNGTTNNSEDTSNHSESWSDDGQQHTDDTTRHIGTDGSSTETEDVTHSEDDFQGSTRTEDNTDSNGNRTRHHEETIIDWDGNCEKTISDDVFDKNGVNIKHTESTKPCEKFSLQVSMEGSITTPSGTITYGPNKVTIPLWSWKDSYEGSWQGEFNATVTGECSGTATYPVVLHVSAKGTDQLDFYVESSLGMAMVGSCNGAGGGAGMPPVTGTTTFNLPAVDGASYTSPRSRAVKLSFTLKREISADDWTH